MKKSFSLLFACLFSAFSAFAVIGSSPQVIENQRVTPKRTFKNEPKKTSPEQLAKVGFWLSATGLAFVLISIFANFSDWKNPEDVVPPPGFGGVLLGCFLLIFGFGLGLASLFRKTSKAGLAILSMLFFLFIVLFFSTAFR